MTEAVAALTWVQDGTDCYQALSIWCPGCETVAGMGLHMLPVAGDTGSRPTWEWNGDLASVTLSPSILTQYSWAGVEHRCHSYLRNGSWEFLGDCTHPLAGQTVPLPPLPEWTLR